MRGSVPEDDQLVLPRGGLTGSIEPDAIRVRLEARRRLATDLRISWDSFPRPPYIFAGDRWNSGSLSKSQYVWWPLTISGTTMSMTNYAQWSLNLGTGVWSGN